MNYDNCRETHCANISKQPYDEADDAVRGGPRVVIPVDDVIRRQRGVLLREERAAQANAQVIHASPKYHAQQQANGIGRHSKQAQRFLQHYGGNSS